MQISPVGPMGVAIAIGFQPTGGGKAAITGDFVLSSDEVNPVIRALRANDIDVTAVHSHMLDEQPRLFFLHFWANDDALKLGRIVNGADTDNTLYNQPEGPGLEAVAEGFRHLGFKDDHEHNAAEWIVYDALYAYCREMVKRGKPHGDFMS